MARHRLKSEEARRLYEAPVLVRRESLAAVTAVKKRLSDGEEAPPPTCWVARAVYGEDNPCWLVFRWWLLEDAPAWLRSLYLAHGRRFAPVVQRRRWLANALRPLMDRAISAKLSAR